MILFQAFSRARRNYRKNTRSCPLYTLPNEIVERIREYLDEVDRSCLALSTSKYLEALCPKGLAIDQKSSAPLSDRIKRDHFYKSRTQWLDRKLGFLWCVSCASSHSRKNYPDHTTSLPRHLRICFEKLDGPFRICPHRLFRYSHFIRLKNLAKARPKDKATRSMAYECKECCCVFDRSCTYRGMELAIRPERNWSTRLPPATRPLFFCRPTVFIERRTSKITIRYTAFLTAQNVRLQLTAPRLRRALQKSRLEICPHMATTDSSTIERLVDEWENASDAGNAWERIGIDCKVCSTKICITKDYMPNIYAVEVVRRLGSLKSPGDPVFRSHCYQRAEVLKETGK
ncbi:hypothetical protein L13192_04846 [Pyrenophora tritici-repentis]|uniref:F-box domain-containing protein n=1 Tax=Pyrenophora tritici-repentis TaxID=45151 RepID=A0A922T1P4_9PLEO|nr:hypothetical protein Ptr86124_004805 [Pyrenophora tritici-repentis]KAI1671489.1 hypothetical protein L13192_04846 [Pyrenophora tritici-repentis]